jgi:hypothetical protein
MVINRATARLHYSESWAEDQPLLDTAVEHVNEAPRRSMRVGRDIRISLPQWAGNSSHYV